MRKIIFLLSTLAIAFTACNLSKETGKVVLISTQYGDMKVRLYDETPLHRDNFIKLTKEGYYDSLLFHRIIKDFMIQGGDPHSKNANAETPLGVGGPDYTIPAEIVYPQYYHKKGAIAAARQGDNVNPDKRSSGSQFYIVQGKTFTDEELDQIDQRSADMVKRKIFYKYLDIYNDSLKALQTSGNSEGLQALQQLIMQGVESDFAKDSVPTMSAELRELYKSTGGTPFLDNGYTVFGEIIEGLDIIDKIAAAKTGNNDRPVDDIRMSVKILK